MAERKQSAATKKKLAEKKAKALEGAIVWPDVGKIVVHDVKIAKTQTVESPETHVEGLNAQGEADIFCAKDLLAVLGTAPTMMAAPWEDENHEIWGVAQCATFPTFKRADILFELHSRQSYWGDEAVRSRLNTWGGRLVMQDHYEDVPRSEKFPIETIRQYRKYHRTSITYMLALAYHSFKQTGKPCHVGLFGVHMEDIAEEYSEQRPCCEYWLGRMEDAGMDIFIAGGAILAAPFQYGYENDNPLIWQMRQRHDGLLNGVTLRQNEHQAAAYEVHKQIGAVTECEYWLRLAQRGELTFESMKEQMEKEKK